MIQSLLVLLVSYLVSILLVLLTVAFFTLFERKVIGLIHSRVGPNKVSLSGLLQPILDAVKLLTKSKVTPLESNLYMYNLSPHISLSFSLLI
jgi:NADH-quinone oxidoreductase subunit H